MSAVGDHLPQGAYLDWSEFSDFDDGQQEQAVAEAAQNYRRHT